MPVEPFSQLVLVDVPAERPETSPIEVLAECSRLLLTGDDLAAVDAALSTVLIWTGAESVFASHNKFGPEIEGFLTIVPNRVATSTMDPDHPGLQWKGGVLPDAAIPDDMEPYFLSTENYAPLEGHSLQIASELSIPIVTGGVFTGWLGIETYSFIPTWTDEQITMLKLIGQMIGAFWEREESRAELRAANAKKDRLIASVSHEIRTPLTMVLGFAKELSSQHVDPAEQAEFLALIGRQAADVSHLVEDLMVAARSDTSDIAVATDQVDLTAEAKAVIDAFECTSDHTITLTGGSTVASADALRVRQVLRNLLTNAVRYGGPAIEVRVLEHRDRPIIEVRDDGDGIPPNLQYQVFEPYQTAHRSEGVPGSLGLGLTVSLDLARLMGGNLTYRRDEGITVFTLTLRPPA